MHTEIKQKHNLSFQEPPDKLIITLQDVRSHAKSYEREHIWETYNFKSSEIRGLRGHPRGADVKLTLKYGTVFVRWEKVNARQREEHVQGHREAVVWTVSMNAKMVKLGCRTK